MLNTNLLRKSNSNLFFSNKGEGEGKTKSHVFRLTAGPTGRRSRRRTPAATAGRGSAGRAAAVPAARPPPRGPVALTGAAPSPAEPCHTKADPSSQDRYWHNPSGDPIFDRPDQSSPISLRDRAIFNSLGRAYTAHCVTLAKAITGRAR